MTPDGGPKLISALIQERLGVDCMVLMGANIASDIANGEFGEAVIGYKDPTNARVFQRLIARPHFDVSLLADVEGAELCGTLKNVVALAAGMVDGMGYGSNTKAAVIRRGLDEMKRFSQRLFPNVRDDTFLETCGVADLITTCYSGRNRKVAAAFTRAWREGDGTTFDKLEQRLLDGQKLQGVLTSNEVQQFIDLRGWAEDFPLFTLTNKIVNGQADPSAMVEKV